jgi:hypothetical protein
VGVGLHTTDGGTTWTEQSTGSFWLDSVHFTDANTGWAVGLYDNILKTTNGGTTWKNQPTGTNTWLNDVCFTDSNTGWVVGPGGAIFSTKRTPHLITQPAGLPATLTRNNAYMVSGRLYPQHDVGTRVVQLRTAVWRLGRWSTGPTFYTSNRDYYVYSQYVGTMTFSIPGQWRVAAVAPADGLHTQGVAPMKYFWVNY